MVRKKMYGTQRAKPNTQINKVQNLAVGHMTERPLGY